MSELNYEILEKRIHDWAVRQPKMQAGLVVGSRARQDHTMDEWSDLDLILFTHAREELASDGGWLEQFGEVWVSWLSINQRGDPEWFALYEDGIKVDIFLAPEPRRKREQANLLDWIKAFPYPDVFTRGIRVLFDKSETSSSDLAKVLLSITKQEAWQSLPDSEAFTNAINGFLISATRVAKLIRRGELWQAKNQLDCDMKRDLLSMLAWHAHATKGTQYDTWYDGRYLTAWVDPHASASLPETYAVYDREDLQRALFATLDIYRGVAVETSERLGFNYPIDADKKITEWVGSVLDNSDEIPGKRGK
jgi:aminoglycoside 6-adenylyltransferase